MEGIDPHADLPGVKMPDETPVEPSAEKPPVELSAQPAGGES